ncbi:hypothetical protein [Pseudonocardia sp. TMWB2A]|uniref:hypothetical protein n=1 Tax=Pseudonocardia sp. TMWB2A TaxID=687430 RepID=UPI00307D705A
MIAPRPLSLPVKSSVGHALAGLFTQPRVDPEDFARAQVGQFTGRRLRIGRSGVVHDVGWRAWLGDLLLPVPACHQGWSGVAVAGDLTAVNGPVTCRKCLARHPGDSGIGGGQEALFTVEPRS